MQWLSYCSGRGTTQTKVKAPQSWLSDKSKGVVMLRQRGGKLRSSYPLKKSLQITRRGLGPRRWTGLKPGADTLGNYKFVVGRRPAWAEARG